MSFFPMKRRMNFQQIFKKFYLMICQLKSLKMFMNLKTK